VDFVPKAGVASHPHLPGAGPGRGRTFSRDPEILRRGSFRHEAILLLKEAFPKLTEGTQQRILSWMEAGPTQEAVRDRLSGLEAK